MRGMGARNLARGVAMALLLALAAGLASAQGSAIGYVKTLQSDATVAAGGHAAPAALGMPLPKGFVVKTSATGSMGITLRDNTLISLGPSTEFAVDDYQFEPGKGELRLWATIGKGTLQYVSGMIAKLRPEAVVVKTPTGIIGVRGTRFVVQVEGDAP
ncbi:MAG: FecR domain-containing protein [Rhodoferax sp.]